MKQRTPRQASRERKLAALKARLLEEQREEHGHNFCEMCKSSTRLLELAHLEGRAQEFNDTQENVRLYGGDLACGCHRKFDSRNKKDGDGLAVLLPRMTH